jgi:23S rRNA pseudouridine1911/1915/1917 synthase
MPQAQFPLHLQVAAEDAGRRLDQFLVAALAAAGAEVSRARVQQLLEQAKVKVEGRPARASLRLRGGERIAISGPAEPPPLRAEAEDIPLDVVYEDEHLAVIHKPAGMMVHAGAGGRGRGTLVNALLHRMKTLSGVGGEVRPGIVHRLDKDTSGLVVVAKTDAAHRRLAEQFAARRVEKGYVALVHGWPKAESGSIAAAIGRDRVRRIRMSTRARAGRQALTRYRVRRRLETPWGRFALLEVEIATGRTHQIRVHLSSLGHPVVGDALYGAPRRLQAQAGRGRRRAAPREELPALGRNFLHAQSLAFAHPETGAAMSFRRPLPAELRAFLERLEAAAASKTGL